MSDRTLSTVSLAVIAAHLDTLQRNKVIKMQELIDTTNNLIKLRLDIQELDSLIREAQKIEQAKVDEVVLEVCGISNSYEDI